MPHSPRGASKQVSTWKSSERTTTSCGARMRSWRRRRGLDPFLVTFIGGCGGRGGFFFFYIYFLRLSFSLRVCLKILTLSSIFHFVLCWEDRFEWDEAFPPPLPSHPLPSPPSPPLPPFLPPFLPPPDIRSLSPASNFYAFWEDRFSLFVSCPMHPASESRRPARRLLLPLVSL